MVIEQADRDFCRAPIDKKVELVGTFVAEDAVFPRRADSCAQSRRDRGGLGLRRAEINTCPAVAVPL